MKNEKLKWPSLTDHLQMVAIFLTHILSLNDIVGDSDDAHDI